MVEPILRAPLNVEWEITRECNLRCKHCYTSAGKKDPEELTTEQVLRIVDHLDTVGISDITFSGGEPLLRDDLEVILADLHRRELPFTVYTNGTLLSRERLQSLKEAGAQSFTLSLNGTTKKTHNFVQGQDTYDVVVKRFSQLKENGLLTQALYTLMKINLQEALELPSLMDDIDLDSVCVYPFYPSGRGINHMSMFEVNGQQLYTTIKELITDKRIFLGGCLKGIFEGSGKSPCAKTMCLVTSEGKLRPCNFLPFQTDGSLLEKDVYTLWKSPLFEKVRTWQDHIERMCDACEYTKTCRGNCLAFHMPLLSDEEVASFK